jgi:mannosyltransferase OCH1-like enzyme
MWFLALAIVVVLLILKSQIKEISIIPIEIAKNNSKGPVSRIIHQTAPSDESKWNPVWKPCQESWKRNFPDWEYRMWTDEDLDEFIKTKYNWFYPTYIGYPQNIMRFDSARYFILYEYGGIYADMDFECVKNFENLLPSGLAFAAETPWDTPGEVYQNALMGSPPKHEYWIHVFEDLKAHQNVASVLNATGPEVIHRVADAYPDLFYSLKSKNFAPPFEDSENSAKLAATTLEDKNSLVMKRFYSKPGPEVYTRHHGSCEWCSLPAAIGKSSIKGQALIIDNNNPS